MPADDYNELERQPGELEPPEGGDPGDDDIHAGEVVTEDGKINVDLLKQNFVKFLKREKLKNTPERHVVLERAAQMDEHFDVDHLCAELYASGERVSKATVYRTVELLVRGGFIKRVIYGERQARYEWNYQVKYHEHLICANCDFIFEFYNPQLELLKAKIADYLGFRPKDSHVEIRGICRRLERDGECHYNTLGQSDKSVARRSNRVIRLPGDLDFDAEFSDHEFRLGQAKAKRPAESDIEDR